MECFSKDYLTDKLNEWLEILEDSEKSDNTLKRYKINITSFIKFADGKEINKTTIKDYKTKLRDLEEYVPNTANNYLVSLNNFLKFLGYGELCVKLLKIQRKDSAEENISYTDYHRLLRCCKRKQRYKTYMLLRVLAETGIRVSELKFFKVETLDYKIEITSKNKIRTIIVTKELLTTLRKYCREQHIYSGYIFPGKYKGAMHDSSVRKALKKAAGYAKVKLEKVHPHALRHYYANRFLEMYPDDYLTLADLLGHSSLETTRIYARQSNKEKEKRLRDVKF